MKKKFKLFATIGSLALAVCMMTIGVLAATQATLGVSTNVTFTANGNYLYLTVKGDMNYAKAEPQTDTWTVKNYEGEAGASAPKSFTAQTFDNVAFEEATRSVTYTFTITNNGANNAYVKITATAPEHASLSLSAANVTTPADNCTKVDGTGYLAKGESIVVSYTLTLDNVNVSITDQNTLSFQLDFSEDGTFE